MAKGWISLSIETLHTEDEHLFDFLEKEFKILHIDHSATSTSNIVRLLVQDANYKWLVPSVDTLIHEYDIRVNMIEGIPNFKVILLHETKTHTY